MDQKKSGKIDTVWKIISGVDAEGEEFEMEASLLDDWEELNEGESLSK